MAARLMQALMCGALDRLPYGAPIILFKIIKTNFYDTAEIALS